VLGRAREEVAHAGDDVGRRVEDRGPEHPVHLARPADDLLAELLLAAREVVVQGAERRLRGGDDLLDPGAGVALDAQQLRAGLDDPLSRGVRHPCRA